MKIKYSKRPYRQDISNDFIYGHQIGVLRDELTYDEFFDAMEKAHNKKINADRKRLKKILKEQFIK